MRSTLPSAGDVLKDCQHGDGKEAGAMVPFIIMGVAILAVIVWVVRTPMFRAYRRSGKDPGAGGIGHRRMFTDDPTKWRR